MSRSHGQDAVLEAAVIWKEQCLLKDGSVFGDGSLWREDLLAVLEDALEMPQGQGSYWDKLHEQLQGKPPEAIALMAEIIWFYYLFSGGVNGETKRSRIKTIHELSGRPSLEAHALLNEETLVGIGASGISYSQRMPAEQRYLIRIARAFKALPEVNRDAKMKDPWQWAEWLASQTEGQGLGMRHMLQHFMFPDEFERVVSMTDKVDILAAFTGDPKRKIKKLDPAALEKALYQVRGAQEKALNTKDLDFYEPPLLERWKPTRLAYLFAWRQNAFPWSDFEEARMAALEGKTVVVDWPCGDNHELRTGDVAWIMKEGKGMVAVGQVAQPSYKGPHWDVNQSKSLWWKPLALTAVVDPEKETIPMSILKRAGISLPRGSWSELKANAANRLKALWAERTGEAQEVQNPEGLNPAVNRIYYGPPGTGKTWLLEKELYPLYEEHPAELPTEVWAERLMGALSWREVLVAALFDLGGSASSKELAEHDFTKARLGTAENRTLAATIRGTLQKHCATSEYARYANTKEPLVFDKNKEGLWCLASDWDQEEIEAARAADRVREGPPPGEKILRHRMVTFHQSYGYEDFVEGIRPVREEDDTVSYRLEPGIFRQVCQEAIRDPEHRYALFIDEINRGNISKIFGELISLVERDKRMKWNRKKGEWEGGLRLYLPYSKDPFGVPGNLDVYGTMNTADRSIALMDTALRRRFTFVEMMPEPELVLGADGSGSIPDGEDGWIDLRELLRVMNQRLAMLLHRDQTLGHAFFINVRNMDDLRGVFLEKVIPLLQEYFYEDWRRIQWVFGDVDGSGHLQDHCLVGHQIQDVAEVFGKGMEPEGLSDGILFTVTPSDKIKPESFRKIYES